MNDQVQRTRLRLSELDRQQQYYFYERLRNPKAFDVLAQAGAFNEVTPPEVVEGRVLHFVWPPTLYLRNVVRAIPEQVADLISRIDTQNERVTYDLVDLVRQIPAALQESLVDKLVQWLDRPHIDYIWSNYVTIMTSLASNGRIAPAFRLARRLLALQIKEDLDIPSLGYRSQSAVAKLGDMAYDHIVERTVDAFISQDPLSLVTLLADHLEEALNIEGREGADADYSSIWAPSLNERPLGSGAKEVLAYRLFGSLRDILRGRTVELDSALEVLNHRRWPLFRRMTVALINEFGTDERKRAELTSEGFMELPDLDRERDELLAGEYSRLGQADKIEILRRINEALPITQRLRDFYKERSAPEDLANRIKLAQDHDLFTRLRPISTFLEGDSAALYSRLSEVFSTEEQGRVRGLWVGPQPPINLQELRSMSTPDLMDYVEVWRAPTKQFAPSAAGLALVLSTIVDERPAEFLSSVDRLLSWPAIYVLHVVQSLRKHVGDADFNFDAFVRLLSFAEASDYDLEATVSEGGAESEEYEDEAIDYGSSLGTAVAFAITDVLRSARMTPEVGGRIWSILEVLLSDRDPTKEDDLRRVGDRAPWNASLNSVRGAAMLAVFDFARWLHRTNGGDENPPNLQAISSDLFEALADHLGPGETSPAVRATYGQNFVSIYAMAPDWTTRAIPAIFEESEAGRAAWQTYLAMNDVYDVTYEKLRQQYSSAVAQLGGEGLAHKDDPAMRGLASHVVRIFARGHSNLDDPDGLIRVFVRNASPEVMGSALLSAGGGLSGSNMPGEVWSRMTSLYEFVLADYARRTLDDRRAALEAFGRWVTAQTIDQEWALATLKRTLAATEGRIWGQPAVLEWLAAVSDIQPAAAVAALKEMTVDTTAFRFLGSDQVRVVLANAIAAGGEALRLAQQVDESLTALGIHDFHSLFELKS